ncbi:hypothetical protein V1264_015602 [Littorina saxatilis]|uniref:Uncharacterized protein n=2 Tax=Littorina saxatilis TaxID=31220 RepID=A0AAN9BLD2_9CAEN
MRCAGDQTEIWAENNIGNWGYALLNGVTLKITTINDDGNTTYQTLRLFTHQLKAYIAAGNFTSSPWEWSSTGSPVDPDKKIVGHYDPDADRGRGVVLVGGLNVSLSQFQGRRGLRIRSLRIFFKCKQQHLHFYEGFPQTFCGNTSNNRSDVSAVQEEIQLDPHHYAGKVLDDYILLVKQKAAAIQTDPFCQEATTIINSAQCASGRDEALYDCAYLLNDRNDYGDCIRYRAYRMNFTVMQVYTTCVRLGCGLKEASNNETCTLLQKIQSGCAYVKYGGYHSDLYVRANCTFTPVSRPFKQRRIYYRGNGQCSDPDRVPSWGYYSSGSAQPGSIETFSKQYRPRTSLPCRYQMANFRCGDYKTEIYVDYTNDIRGNTFLDGVIIKALTKTADRQRLVQTNRLTNEMLKQYIEAGDFSQRLWNWTYRGDTEPPPGDRIIGQFNQTTNSGVYITGNLTVTYNYIDSNNASRGVADALVIRCADPNFRTRQSYPQTLCGSPKDTVPGNNAALSPPRTSDLHHHYGFYDPLFLVRQHAKQSNPLCDETSSIVSSGECEQLGDALYECNEIRDSYTSCLRSNDIDVFKVFTTCLRVMCGTAGATSTDTCSTLQDVAGTCGYSKAHMNLRTLFAKASCSPPSKSNSKTTAEA